MTNNIGTYQPTLRSENIFADPDYEDKYPPRFQTPINKTSSLGNIDLYSLIGLGSGAIAYTLWNSPHTATAAEETNDPLTDTSQHIYKIIKIGVCVGIWTVAMKILLRPPATDHEKIRLQIQQRQLWAFTRPDYVARLNQVQAELRARIPEINQASYCSDTPTSSTHSRDTKSVTWYDDGCNSPVASRHQYTNASSSWLPTWESLFTWS